MTKAPERIYISPLYDDFFLTRDNECEFEYIRADLAQCVVPKGWKLVPEQPTEEMRLSIWRAQYTSYASLDSEVIYTPEFIDLLTMNRVNCRIQKKHDELAYKAMLAAAPEYKGE